MKNFAVKCENSSGKPAAKWYYSQGDNTCFVTVFAKVGGESKEIICLRLNTDDDGKLNISFDSREDIKTIQIE